MTEQRTARDIWNELYSESEKRWSGEPNPSMVKLLENRTPGTVLDLGCGEGGDVFWLAQQGWTPTGIDVSDVAIERARAKATQLGIHADFVAADLTEWRTDQKFSVITSSFLQSFEAFDRIPVLKQALEYLEVGGEFISVSHAGAPSFAKPDDRRHGVEMPDPKVEAATLVPADEHRFSVETAETWTREVTSPEGESGTIPDGILVIKRIAE